MTNKVFKSFLFLVQEESNAACNLPDEEMVTGENLDEVRAVALAFDISVKVCMEKLYAET